MLRILSFITLLTISSQLMANPVTEQTATKVATTKLGQMKASAMLPTSNVILHLKTKSTISTTKSGNQASYYVFDISNDNGFIIVAGDDASTPILGYSNKGNFTYDQAPKGILQFLEEINSQMTYLVNESIAATPEIVSLWQNYERGTIPTAKASVAPLTTTTWTQRNNGYSQYTPPGTPTGCVATAVSQVMAYYRYPEQGMGYKSYNDDKYGTMAANFGGTYYKWADMPNALAATSTPAQKEAVGRLMYHVGVSIDMDYNPSGSSAYTYAVRDALINRYAYSTDMQYLTRSSYTETQWINKIKTELDARRVVLHSGFCPSPAAGHAFVFDGYDDNNLIHVNWGWGGSYNGYFTMSNLNPGSTYTFNANQAMLVGIKPNVNISNKLRLASAISVPVNASIAQGFSVSTSLKNTTNTTFTGKLMAAIFDNNDNQIAIIETKPNITIAGNASQSYTFSTAGLNITPGTYKVGVYSAVGSTANWMLANKYTYTNPKNIYIKTTNDLRINTDPTIANIYIPSQDAVTVTATIKNYAITAFNGKIEACLYSLQGNFWNRIELKNSVSIAANASQTLTFTNPTGFTGTYASYWLVFRSTANNSVVSTFLVGNAAIASSKLVHFVDNPNKSNTEDRYESNNTFENSFQYPAIEWNEDNTAAITLEAANHHTLVDADYYTFQLPDGYEYEVNSYMYDRMDEKNGVTYYGDATYNYYANATWSNPIEVAECTPFITTDKEITYKVTTDLATQNIGTYCLTIQLKRKAINVLDNAKPLVYPNPATTTLHIDFATPTTSLAPIQLMDMQGKIVKQAQIMPTTTTYDLDINNLSSGTYLLYSLILSIQQKIVIQK